MLSFTSTLILSGLLMSLSSLMVIHPKLCPFFTRRFAHLSEGVKSLEKGLTKTTGEVRLSYGGVYFSICVLLFAWSFVQHVSLDLPGTAGSASSSPSSQQPNRQR